MQHRDRETPLTISQTLKQGFGLMRASWKFIWGFGLASALLDSGGNLYKALRSLPVDPDSSGSLGLFALVLSMVFYGACYLRQEAILIRAEGGFWFSDALGYAPKLLLAWIVVLALTLIAGAPMIYFMVSDVWSDQSILVRSLCILTLAIPALLVLTYLAFSSILIVIEDRGPIESLTMSRALVSGDFRHTAAVLGIGALIILAGFIVVSITTMYAGDLVSVASEILYDGLLVVPFLTALLMVLYYDLSARKQIRTDGATSISASGPEQ